MESLHTSLTLLHPLEWRTGIALHLCAGSPDVVSQHHHMVDTCHRELLTERRTRRCEVREPYRFVHMLHSKSRNRLHGVRATGKDEVADSGLLRFVDDERDITQ